MEKRGIKNRGNCQSKAKCEDSCSVYLWEQSVLPTGFSSPLPGPWLVRCALQLAHDFYICPTARCCLGTDKVNNFSKNLTCSLDAGSCELLACAQQQGELPPPADIIRFVHLKVQGRKTGLFDSLATKTEKK